MGYRFRERERNYSEINRYFRGYGNLRANLRSGIIEDAASSYFTLFDPDESASILVLGTLSRNSKSSKIDGLEFFYCLEIHWVQHGSMKRGLRNSKAFWIFKIITYC